MARYFYYYYYYLKNLLINKLGEKRLGIMTPPPPPQFHVRLPLIAQHRHFVSSWTPWDWNGIRWPFLSKAFQPLPTQRWLHNALESMVEWGRAWSGWGPHRSSLKSLQLGCCCSTVAKLLSEAGGIRVIYDKQSSNWHSVLDQVVNRTLLMHNIEPWSNLLFWPNACCPIQFESACVITPLISSFHFPCRKHALNCHRMKPALFNVLCEIKEKTGKEEFSFAFLSRSPFIVFLKDMPFSQAFCLKEKEAASLHVGHFIVLLKYFYPWMCHVHPSVCVAIMQTHLNSMPF